MQRKTKIKVAISVISAILIYFLVYITACILETIIYWIPFVEQYYLIGQEKYYFAAVGCFLLILFIIAVNLVIWLYDKIFKNCAAPKKEK